MYNKIVKLCFFFAVKTWGGGGVKNNQTREKNIVSACNFFFAVCRVIIKKLDNQKKLDLLQYMRTMYNCQFRTAPHSDLHNGTSSTKHQVLSVATNELGLGQ